MVLISIIHQFIVAVNAAVATVPTFLGQKVSSDESIMHKLQSVLT
jgi:hypothetical protein